MIKILQVFGALNCGGAETMLMNLYRKIDTSEIQFDFVKHTEQECYYDKEIIDKGGVIYSCPRYTVINHFKYVKWWNDFFSSHPEYKVVHSHIRSTASIILRIAKMHGCITISHSHSTSNGKGFAAIIKKNLQSKIPKYSDYCFACTYNSGKWLFGEKVVKSEKFKVIPNAIDTEKYKFSESVREKMRSELGIKENVVYGHVGRFHPAKNHGFLLELFAEIHSKQPNSVLLLIGDGELRGEIESKIAELSLQDSVILTGVRSDVHLLMQAMDVFLFPSAWEGLPLTVVEAQAAGLPCFVSDTVTKEVFLSELVEYLSIFNGVQVWLNEILTCNLVRTDVLSEIKSSGFDINSSVEEITSFYRSFFKE